MRSFALLAALPALIAAAPILSPRDPKAEVVPGKYIVVFKKQAAGTSSVSAVNSVVELLGGKKPDSHYNIGTFQGLALSSISDATINLISALSTVDYIEKDSIVSINTLTSQTDAPWGLGRISNRDPGSTTYNFDDTAGTGTFSYIIDTGIFVDHPDFGGRAQLVQNFAGDGQDTDCNGHGTHVAGTTGSNTYGVAKNTALIGVKVLGCDGSGQNTGIIDGINWVANDVVVNGRQGKAVANLSLGGGFSQASNDAVAGAISQGVFFAVAAGNDGQDTANFSPSSTPEACTVGATDINDNWASFSNFGSLVDILAPGVDVVSTYNDGQTASLSGTSMATPHIAGLGAYLLALEGPRDAAALCGRIQELAGQGRIQGVPDGTINSIAFNGSS